MKKILISLAIMNNLYAIPPCKYANEKVCMYLYRSPLSAEIILINLSKEKIIVKYANAMLNGKYETINNAVLQSGQAITMLSKRYDNYEENLYSPYHHIGMLSYKTIKKETPQTTKNLSDNKNRKENIKIEIK
jgi:hypothetical protein